VSPSGSVLDARTLYTRHISPRITWTGSSYGITVYEYDVDQIVFSRLSPTGEALGSETRIGEDADYDQILAWTGSEFALLRAENRGFHLDNYFISWMDATGVLSAEEDLTHELYGDNHGMYSLIWTGSELGVSWATFGDWGTDSIGTAYLTCYSSDRTRTTPDFEVSDNFVSGDLVPVLWTGSEYLLLGWDDRTGSWEVYMNRLRFCE
jgi:hypothetical protein